MILGEMKNESYMYAVTDGVTSEIKQAEEAHEIDICFAPFELKSKMSGVIALKAKELAKLIQMAVPAGKERVIAINMCESAMMWAHAGILRREVVMVKTGDS
jgi:predicted peroxiredoxin